MLRKYFKHKPYKSRKVLLVDDEEDLGWILQKIIRDAGHTLIFASTFEDGMQKFKKTRDLDMGIVDLRLQDEDGLTFVRKAKTINPKVKLIMISAFGNGEVKNKATQLGVAHFFDKPLRPEKLLDIINHI